MPFYLGANNPWYLPEGWYWSDELSEAVGPYSTMELAYEDMKNAEEMEILKSNGTD